MLLIDFSARGGELVILEAEDLKVPGWTSEKGVKLAWPTYTEGTERLKYSIVGGKPKRDLVLPFYAVWKTTAVPAAEIACTVETSAGKATAKTSGGLEQIAPPIAKKPKRKPEDGRKKKTTKRKRTQRRQQLPPH